MGRDSNGEGRGDSVWCNNPSVILIPLVWIIWVWLHGKLRDVSVSVFDLLWLKRGWWNLENRLKFCQKTLKRSPKLGEKTLKTLKLRKIYLYTLCRRSKVTAGPVVNLPVRIPMNIARSLRKVATVWENTGATFLEDSRGWDPTSSDSLSLSKTSHVQ